MTANYYQLLPSTKVSDLLLRYLQLEGATTAFGIPGGGLKNMLNSLMLQRATFRYVICRHETGAAYMADGFARTSGTIGVVFTTSGPGACNALTGVTNANEAGTPLLIITGEPPQQFDGMGYLQEGVDMGLDINEIYKSAVSYSAVLTTPGDAPTLIEQALRVALGTPSAAAHLSLPDDVSSSMTTAGVRFPTEPRFYRASPKASNPNDATLAWAHLSRAKRPAILLGNGARSALAGGAMARFMDVVEQAAIPVMTTMEGKAVFPETHDMSLRAFGMAYSEWCAQYIAPTGGEPYDCLLVLGSSLGELATGAWGLAAPQLLPNGPMIQVDVSAHKIGNAYPVQLGIVADIAEFLPQLADAAMAAPVDPDIAAERRAAIAAMKNAVSPFLNPALMDSTASPMLPQALMKTLNGLLPPGTQFFIDGGNCIGWAVHYLVLDPPTVSYVALDLGPMGFGVAGVVGGKLGAPQSPCVALVGDAAFMMFGSEISTAAANKVGAIWLVLYDNDMAMVSQGQAHFCPDPADPTVWTDYYSLGSPNLAAYAAALGATSYDAHSPADITTMFPKALAGAAQGVPQVIICHIDTTQVPPYYQYTPPAPAAPAGSSPPHGSGAPVA